MPNRSHCLAPVPRWAAIVIAAMPCVSALHAPASEAHRLADVVARLREEGLARGQAYAMLQSLCSTAPLRLAGSDGAARAVEWARERMIALELENVRLEACTVPHWTRGTGATLTLAEPKVEPALRLDVLALGGSVPTPSGGTSGEVLQVESFDELDRLGDRVQGRIVFFNRRMDPSLVDPFEAYRGAVDQRARGAVEAARRGAVAAIVRSVSSRIDDSPHTGGMRYAENVPEIPAAAISTAGADRLAALLDGGTRVRVTLVQDCRTLDPVPSSNVIGEIRGREKPDEIVLLGAHLDAWDVGQGAHDDGAGCAHVLETMRLLKVQGLRPRRTLRAVLFMNEENGLRGGLAYRDQHLADLDAHVLALESDRGGFAPRGFATDSGPTGFAILRELTDRLEPAGLLGLVGGDGGADISPLARHGVPLVELVTDPQRYFDYHHCERDTIDAVHPRELELGAVAMASFVFAVADLESALPRNPKH